MVKPELTGLLSIGMFVLTLVRFIGTTGPKLSITLSYKRISGIGWAGYVKEDIREEIVLSIVNTGSYPTLITSINIGTKKVGGRISIENLVSVEAGYRKLSLPHELDPGEKIVLHFSKDWLQDGTRIRALVWSVDRKCFKSAWLIANRAG